MLTNIFIHDYADYKHKEVFLNILYLLSEHILQVDLNHNTRFKKNKHPTSIKK